MATIPIRVRCASTLGPDVHHHTSHSMNHRIEQDHQGIKQRSYLLHEFDSAAHFCTAHDELRDHLRPRPRFKKLSNA